MRLGDVIEKTQSELNTSKIQLSQIQRQEAQSRQELDSIRSLTNNKDKRGKELQVYKYSNRVRYPLRNNYVIVNYEGVQFLSRKMGFSITCSVFFAYTIWVQSVRSQSKT